VQSQSQEQLNVIFVVDVILKMGLPVFMADNAGFLEWLAMLNPKIQLKHRKSLSSLLKQIAAALFDQLKVEIKAALTDGSKLALAVDAWTGVNHTQYLEVRFKNKAIWVQHKKQMGEDGFMNLVTRYRLLVSGMHAAVAVVSPPQLASSTDFKWPSS
jgi:hypothetical protein